MSVALDFGAWHLKSLWFAGDRLSVRRCPSVYAVLPDSDSHRQALKRMSIPYGVCEEALLLIGDDAVDYAGLFQVPCVPLLPGGKIPRADPPARQILAALVASLLPESNGSDEICCLTFSGANDGGDRSEEVGDSEFLTRLVEMQGYKPLVLPAGLAVVLAEGVKESFTGIGLAIGAETSELSLAHCGQQVIGISIGRGGRWIDEQLARECEHFAWDADGNRYLDTATSLGWEESFSGSILQPATVKETLLAHLCQELVTHVIQEAARELARSPGIRSVPQPLSLVCSGGITQIPGFNALLERTVLRTPFPVEIQNVRLATDPNDAVVRGCLIRAELEAETMRQQRAA